MKTPAQLAIEILSLIETEKSWAHWKDQSYSFIKHNDGKISVGIFDWTFFRFLQSDLIGASKIFDKESFLDTDVTLAFVLENPIEESCSGKIEFHCVMSKEEHADYLNCVDLEEIDDRDRHNDGE